MVAYGLICEENEVHSNKNLNKNSKKQNQNIYKENTKRKICKTT